MPADLTTLRRTILLAALGRYFAQLIFERSAP